MRKILLTKLILFLMSVMTFAQNEFSESAPYNPSDVPQIKWKEDKEGKKSKKNQDEKNQDVVPTATDITPTIIGESKLESESVPQIVAVTVSDAADNAVQNLQKNDFRIFVNDVEQKIDGFGTSDEPLNIVLMVDISPSASYEIEAVQKYANTLVSQLEAQDKVLVMSFAEKTVALTGLTTDRQEISKAIKKLKFGDGTSIYEAVKFSLQKRISLINGRKIVILITDGVDTTSRKANFEDSLIEAEKNDAAFYVVYVDTSKYFVSNKSITSILNGAGITAGNINQNNKGWKEEYENGRRYLANLAALSGGQIIAADITKTKSTGFENVFEAVRNQFYLGFTPSEKGVSNQRRQIKVRVNRSNLRVRARGSYIVSANIQTAK